MKFYFPIFLFFVMLFSCSRESEKNNGMSDEDGAVCINPESLNPNGDSELALLMRKMTEITNQMQKEIPQGKLLPYPSEFTKILTAEPTDSAIKNPAFEGYATAFLYTLDELYNSDEILRIRNFNIMVSHCVSCHNDFCHGPIKRIEKLKIREGDLQ